MALLIPGLTKCPLCGEVINKDDQIESFWHFIEDSKDPLYEYSDASFHKACFDIWEMRDEYLMRYSEFEKRMRIPKLQRRGLK